ncbi:MAG: hypothetical protein JXR96_22780 [Deltaproteobacteria bacterium]|nr:hypothetical protein [Deltaproteobacteria bacterium]
MKFRGKFEKQEIEVGLSIELPMDYRGPEEKYTLADIIAHSTPKHIRFEKRTVEFEIYGTSTENKETPERYRCHLLVSNMPDIALPEVEEELRDTYEHYISIDLVSQHPSLPPPSRPVTATVINHVKT